MYPPIAAGWSNSTGPFRRAPSVRVPTSNFAGRRDRTRESELEAWVQLTPRPEPANCQLSSDTAARSTVTSTISLAPTTRRRCSSNGLLAHRRGNASFFSPRIIPGESEGQIDRTILVRFGFWSAGIGGSVDLVSARMQNLGRCYQQVWGK